MTPRGEAPAFDWELYWQSHRPSKEMRAGGRRMARRIETFVRLTKIHPNSLADLGCGPATTLFELAKRFPAWTLAGYDRSPTVVAANRARAANEHVANARFGVVELPSVPGGQFDLVVCIATLHYVPDIRRAMHNLFGLVRQGGYLIFNYPNRTTRHWYAREAAKDGEVRKRFGVLLAGENLMTRRDCREALGVPVGSFWAAVGEPPLRTNPCLVVKKPEDSRTAGASSSARSSR